MTPQDFVAKWKGAALKESAGSQSHFNDLCALLAEETPVEADPTGTWYCFEKGLDKAGGGSGFADVWRKDRFGWEYKGPGKSLDKAFQQLTLYAPALGYPPLMIVSDMETIRIHTAFTGLVPEVHVLGLDDLLDHEKRRLLKWAFSDPDRLRPQTTVAALTEEVAARFAELAQTLRLRGHAPEEVAHFVQQLLFCMFAEDIDLLPGNLFTRMLETGKKQPKSIEGLLAGLFEAMAKGGTFGVDAIDWFNGGLFDSSATLPLEAADIDLLLQVARLDWSAIDAMIFGTLFERGLDPVKRSQLGAHYTDEASIMRLVVPVVLQPVRDAWVGVRADIQGLLAKADDGSNCFRLFETLLLAGGPIKPIRSWLL